MLLAHECSCFFGLLLVKVSGRSVEHGHLPRCVHKDGIVRRLFSVSRMNGLRGLYDGRLFGCKHGMLGGAALVALLQVLNGELLLAFLEELLGSLLFLFAG